MSHYAYCGRKDCQASLHFPTLRDELYGWTCEAGHLNEITGEQRALILIDLEDRIERLETLLEQTK